MYPISNSVKALFDAEQKQVLRITGTDKNGAAISITDANVDIGSFNIDRFACNGQKLEIGTAIASQLTLNLINTNGQYDSIVFEGSELFVEIGIADWSQQTPTISYIPCGYFTPDQQPRKLNTIELKALDRMTRFDAVHPTLTPWTDNNGNVITDGSGNIIYFCAELSFPCTIAQLVEKCCIRCQVPFNQDLSSFPNYNYIVLSLPVIQQEITFRNIIQWCAAIMGACAFIDWTGHLVFKWYTAASYTTTTANRYASDLAENDITITGVKYTTTQNTVIIDGTDDYALDMTGNYLAAGGIATIIIAVNNAVNGFTYRPFSASIINAPYLWPLDVITFTDKDGVDHSCAVTNVNFGINGITMLEGRGQTAQDNDGVVDSGLTKTQQLVFEQAIDIIHELDNSLDQEGIFNRLTEDGTLQGLYMYNGQLYVNMSYARSGTLVLGGLNNQDGALQVLDAGGNTVGTWNSDGIDVKKGDINISWHKYVPYQNLYGYTRINSSGGLVCELHNGTTGFQTITNFDSGSIASAYNLNDVQLDKIEMKTSSGLLEFTRDRSSWQATSAQIGVTINNSYNGSGGVRTATAYYHDRELYINDNGVVVVDVKLEGATVGTDVTVSGNVSVSGTKSRRVATDQYSDRLLYCYETPSPMFGDVGEGVIGEDGRCYVPLDAVFAQTVSTEQYQVFLQKYGDGDCWVNERRGGCFIVQGTPGLAFGWEVKAKQRGFDQKRLDRAEEPFEVPEQTYGDDAVNHIMEIKKEREAK